jgi:antitoxin (DNA-binding transcriptional repressor) of toxin-antitoxin stability system
MEKIKTVGLQSLKKHLSSYLQDVRAGVRILITDHQEWVAELREPDMAYRENARPMASAVHDDEDELQLFRSLSKEARSALLAELEKV